MESTSGRAKSRENGKLLPFSHFSSHPAGPMQSGRFPNLPSQVVIEEEQPSWLDDLLSDTRTLFYRGHRRSASDSCAYLAAEAFVLDDESDFVNAYFGSPPGPKNMDTKDSGEVVYSVAVERSGHESSAQNVEESADSQAKIAGSKTELKRAKQHNAQRSRIRKLQYIAHLERTIEILKAEGAGVSADLEFMEQQNMLLTMENQALRQRLESISQEQMIKQWEQGILEREIGRLQSIYHMQKQQQMHPQHNQLPKHRRSRTSLDDHVNHSIAMKTKDAIPNIGPIRV
ncbi:basic leucine zipper 6-like [Salvia hispanica]|uniref:basic leucine zipper 6-like n=1 Tax=Salvia hispanica TaxID=49212 RepID=UPI002009AB4C|nr:basic leucine zipper 6-like [Salvia hispanica]